jgi:cell division protease FtsH
MTTGAGNDIERATEMAHKMVCEWGMSELGPLSFGKKDEQIFLGREIAQHRDYSEETAIKIDQQVRKLVEDGYNEAKQIILERREALVRIAEALLEREGLDGAEVLDLINGRPLKALVNTKPSSTPDNTGGTVIAPHPSPLPGLMGGESPQPA